MFRLWIRDGQLPAVDGQLFELDLLPLQAGDGQPNRFGRDRARDDLLPLERAGDFFGGVRDPLAADHVPVTVFPFPDEDGHGLPLYFFTFGLSFGPTANEVGRNASLRSMMSVSSSGNEVTDIAVSSVIALLK
jgi:hypothetical protein